MAQIVVNKAGVEHRFCYSSGSENSWINNWLATNFESWENETFSDFQKITDTEDKIALDIGAWVGTTAIWLSKHYHTVYAVEADPISITQLKTNLLASNCFNARVLEQAISDKEETVYFGPNRDGTQCFNTSMSQIKKERTCEVDIEGQTITFNKILELCDRPIGLIKIDIEGGEENLVEPILKYAQENRTCVHLSFHINWWQNQDINRFAEIFGDRTNELISLLKIQPFAAVFFDYR